MNSQKAVMKRKREVSSAEMLRGLFEARRFAIIGVSAAENNLGRFAANNLLDFGYTGEAFFIGRSGGEVAGREILSSIDEIPGELDLVSLLVPRGAVPGVLEEAAQKGARWAVVCTSGYSEFSEKGAAAEAEVLDILERYDMHIVGPNTIGVINMGTKMTTIFGPLPIENLRDGPVAIVAQSGSASIKLSEVISKCGLGFNRCVAIGNKLDLDEVDFLHCLAEDPLTEVICFYLEGFQRGEQFVEEARRCKKPVLVYKTGVTSAGGRLARTHTGALMSDDRVVNAALRSAGVLRVQRMRDLVLASNVVRLPALRNKKIAVLSPGAGYGVMVSDHCEKLGFSLPRLGDEVLEAVKALGRTDATTLGTNPLDLGQFYDPQSLLAVVRTVAAADEIDGVIAVLPFREILSGEGHSSIDTDIETARTVKQTAQKVNKPIVVAAMADHPDLPLISRQADFPILGDPEDAPVAMSLLWQYSSGVSARQAHLDNAEEPLTKIDRAAAESYLRDFSNNGSAEVGMECMPVLRSYGLPVLEPRLATTVETAGAIAAEFGVPLAMKINSPDVLHKSDMGGVRLDVCGSEQAAHVYAEIIAAIQKKLPTADILGVDIQPMVNDGWEVIVGAVRDAQFGPVILFGAGGIYTEVLDDVSIRSVPMTLDEATQMIQENRLGRILSGVRGQNPSDTRSLADVIVRVSRLMADFEQITALDLNPVRVLADGNGCRIVDARMIIEP